jgi:hypothetical protein
LVGTMPTSDGKSIKATTTIHCKDAHTKALALKRSTPAGKENPRRSTSPTNALPSEREIRR